MINFKYINYENNAYIIDQKSKINKKTRTDTPRHFLGVAAWYTSSR